MESVHESDVLKALDPSIKNDEDAWPQFPLRDVSIVSQKTGRPMSLLQAHKTGKVRVIGTLHDQDADQEARKRFKKRFQKQQRMYIADVDMYSYGKYEDDSLAFWAAGEAGWFELRTQVEGYKRLYASMEEATEMLYFLIERATRQRKDWTKAKDAQVETIMIATFKAFVDSKLNKHRSGDWKDCREGFIDRCHFLIKCMLEGAEGINWDNTPFLRWYEKTVPRDYAVIRDIVQQTGSVSIEDLLSEPARTAVTRQRASKEKAPRETTPEEMDLDKPAPMGRRSKRLAEAAASDEGNSSDDLSRKRGRARGKHKRKSMLRIPGSAKTPKKTNVGPRHDGLYALREPEMEYFRETRKLDEEDTEFLPERPPRDDSISPGLARDLKYAELHADTETAKPTADYWVAKGPSGTWTCPIDGCAHQVWDAESATGHEMVKTHYGQVHQDSIEELIRSESRPWAKTSYLLEKVRSMKAQGLPAADAAKGKAPAKRREEPEQIFPAPIKRVLRQ